MENLHVYTKGGQVETLEQLKMYKLKNIWKQYSKRIQAVKSQTLFAQIAHCTRNNDLLNKSENGVYSNTGTPGLLDEDHNM